MAILFFLRSLRPSTTLRRRPGVRPRFDDSWPLWGAGDLCPTNCTNTVSREDNEYNFNARDQTIAWGSGGYPNLQLLCNHGAVHLQSDWPSGRLYTFARAFSPTSAALASASSTPLLPSVVVNWSSELKYICYFTVLVLVHNFQVRNKGKTIGIM